MFKSALCGARGSYHLPVLLSLSSPSTTWRSLLCSREPDFTNAWSYLLRSPFVRTSLHATYFSGSLRQGAWDTHLCSPCAGTQWDHGEMRHRDTMPYTHLYPLGSITETQRLKGRGEGPDRAPSILPDSLRLWIHSRQWSPSVAPQPCSRDPCCFLCRHWRLTPPDPTTWQFITVRTPTERLTPTRAVGRRT